MYDPESDPEFKPETDVLSVLDRLDQVDIVLLLLVLISAGVLCVGMICFTVCQVVWAIYP